MSFYSLSKEERISLVNRIYNEILSDIPKNKTEILSDIPKNKNSVLHTYFSDADTYIRKTAYQSVGKIFFAFPNMQPGILSMLNNLYTEDNEKIRQTTINSAGEIGIKNFEAVEDFFDRGLFDEHHSVRNAVIGSVKKMGEKNPVPVLKWSKRYLHHEDKEIRREVCHGIELRGRTHPEEILPLLKELQFDKTLRVKKTLVHVIGQISYKKGCIEKVIADLKTWENKELVKLALEEIIDVHYRYKNFAVKTQKEARDYIKKAFGF